MAATHASSSLEQIVQRHQVGIGVWLFRLCICTSPEWCDVPWKQREPVIGGGPPAIFAAQGGYVVVVLAMGKSYPSQTGSASHHGASAAQGHSLSRYTPMHTRPRSGF